MCVYKRISLCNGLPGFPCLHHLMPCHGMSRSTYQHKKKAEKAKTSWSPAATRTMPCLTALHASVAVAYVWPCCWVGVLRCLRCKQSTVWIKFRVTQLPIHLHQITFIISIVIPLTSTVIQFTSIYINLHHSYLSFLSSVLDCAVHYLLATEVGRLGGCRAILSQKTRHEEFASLTYHSGKGVLA